MNDEEIKNIILNKKMVIELMQGELAHFKKKVEEAEKELWDFRKENIHEFSNDLKYWDSENLLVPYSEMKQQLFYPLTEIKNEDEKIEG